MGHELDEVLDFWLGNLSEIFFETKSRLPLLVHPVIFLKDFASVSARISSFFSEVIMLELVPEETSKNSEKSWEKFEQNVLRKTRDELKEES